MANTVPPEPDTNSVEKVSTLKMRLPDGTVVQRRFLASVSLQVVISYLGSEGYFPDEYKIITSYPRKDVSACTSALVMVECVH